MSYILCICIMYMYKCFVHEVHVHICVCIHVYLYVCAFDAMLNLLIVLSSLKSSPFYFLVFILCVCKRCYIFSIV